MIETTDIEQLKRDFSGELRENEPLAKHTYYRIGGPARLLAIPEGLSDLEALAAFVDRARVPVFVLGKGTNVLFSDDGFDGLVIKLGKVNTTLNDEGDCVEIGASVAIVSLLKEAGNRGWAGFERLAGVPGSVGGVVYMNAGTHLGEIRELVRSVEVYSLTQKERRRLSGTELQFSYRRNHFLQPGDIVVSTRWEYEPAAPEWVKQKIQEILDRRKRTQPIEYPSCGSVFKNPKNPRYHHSWQVIEALGLRGHRIGAAQFSEKHPNFIVNHGGAKASDVKALIELAKQRASQELGVKLEEEVQVVG